MFAPPPVDPLLHRIRSGDEHAFEHLFHAEHAGLCSFADRMLSSPHLAEEVVQSVFLRLWTSRRTLPALGSVRAYLYKATRNAALDHLKHAALEDQWAAATAAEGDQAGSEPEVEALATERERSDALFRAIELLSPRARQAVVLRWLRGMTYPEVADALGISVKGVEIHVTRALRALRGSLGIPRPPD